MTRKEEGLLERTDIYENAAVDTWSLTEGRIRKGMRSSERGWGGLDYWQYERPDCDGTVM